MSEIRERLGGASGLASSGCRPDCCLGQTVADQTDSLFIYQRTAEPVLRGGSPEGGAQESVGLNNRNHREGLATFGEFIFFAQELAGSLGAGG